MSSTFFKKPFDEPTITKLELYKAYVNEWLPVFLVPTYSPITKKVNIFDFFSGVGKDTLGQHGSPLIALNALNTERYKSEIKSKDLEVNIWFNDRNTKYINQLEQNVKALKLKNLPVNIHFLNLDFAEAYDKLKPEMQNAANLVFLDQFGVQCVDKGKFQELSSMTKTDILFFISSSSFNRFYEHETFKKIVNISKEELSKTSFLKIHRIVLDKYKEYLPKNKNYYLAPFSIKRDSNINGLIFGSGHLLGIEKFLKVCWQQDKIRGEANFDIDNEKIPKEGTGLLFPEYFIPTKRSVFESELKRKVLEGELKTDKEIYIFTVTNGFLGSHAKPIIQELKKAKRINYKGQIALSFSGAIKDRMREPKKIEILK
jgi:three-Cys-motif partner protein